MRREHSRAELAAKLIAKGFAAVTVRSVADQLTVEGQISDDRFAQCVIRQRIASGYGPRRLRWELRSRGVDEAIINEHLNQGDDEWRALILALHQKRFGKTRARGRGARAREVRFLQARGFTLEQIRDALRDEL